MKVQTPLMYARQFLPDGYEQYIVSGFMTARGSGDNYHDDFTDARFQPDTGVFERFSDKSFSADNDNTAATLDSGSRHQFAIDSDIVAVLVAKIRDDATAIIYNTGAVSQGVVLRYSGSAGATYADDAAGTGTISTALVPAGKTVIMASALDYSDATTGLKQYTHDFDTDSTYHDEEGAQDLAAAISPTAVQYIKGFEKIYGTLIFDFGTGGLPLTWKEDMLAFGTALRNSYP